VLALRKIQCLEFVQPNRAVPPSKPSPVQKLEAMGFSRDVCERALAQAGGDPERAVEIILGGGGDGVGGGKIAMQVQDQPGLPKFTSPPPSDEREMSEATQRLQSRPANDNLPMSVWYELPKKKKDQGWTIAKLQEAMNVYNLSNNQHAAQLYSDVMTGKLTLEELAQASEALAFGIQDDSPLDRRQSATGECAVCFEEHSSSIMYSRVCEKRAPISAHGGSAAPEKGSGESNCLVCYPGLFDGLHFQFMSNQLPHCVACNTPLHQTAFDEMMKILEANFSRSLGAQQLDNKVCTCGALQPSMFAGFAAQNPESLSSHKKECSFAVIKRMRNQVG
jgi:hypothetical protein